MVKIVTVASVDEAVPAILNQLQSRRLLRVEGFCGDGKTTLSRRVSELTRAVHIEADKFANKFDQPPPYPACIRQAELDRAIGAAIASVP